MPKRHPPEVRAAAVAAVVAGEQPAAVAKRYGISRGLLRGWCAQDLPQPEFSDRSRTDHARTRERMAELIYDCLVDIFGTLRDQLRAATDEAWLAQQSAGDVAALLDKEIDGAIRLLAGFRPAETDDVDERGPSLRSGRALPTPSETGDLA